MSTPPVAHAAMLIRRPVAEVFTAITAPETITKFWFTHSSGPLAPDATVTWTWAMYDLTTPVRVTAFVPNERIELMWGEDTEATKVVWTFQPHEGDTTFIEVTNSGFAGTEREQVAAALDATGGFTWVLAGLKAWLEHGIQLNLTADRFPPGLTTH